jgi:hypothetical protein
MLDPSIAVHAMGYETGHPRLSTADRQFAERVFRLSKSEEIRNCDEHDSDRNEQSRVGYEVGKDHQSQATDQWDNSPLFATIDEKAKPD